jgi:gluconokinase
MASSSLVVALDVGTSSARALAFDTSGAQVGPLAQIPYSQTTTPDGGVECDALALLGLVEQCLEQLLQNVEGEVVGIGTSCFMHSLLAVDASGAPLSGVVSWADNRSRAHVAVLRELVDEDGARARTGCPFHTSYWPAKLLWLRDTRPELFAGPLQWMSFGEFLARRWCKQARVSFSMASGTGLFDGDKCQWDDEMLSHLPIERAQLSSPCDADEPLELTDEFLSRFPRLKGAKMFPALGDGACSNIGGGGANASTLVLNAGTSGALRVVLPGFVGAPPRGLWRYRVDRKRALVGGAISNCGNALAWGRATFNLPPDWELQVAGLAPDSHGLSVLPFLAGERAPLWNPNVHFALAGAGLHTSPVQIMRALMEAAALRYRVLFDLLHPLAPGAQIVFSGGALEHVPAWQTIVCDALGQSLCASKEAEASARGAALMALEALKIIPDVGAASFERGDVLQPDSRNSPVYERALERQNALEAKLYEPS